MKWLEPAIATVLLVLCGQVPAATVAAQDAAGEWVGTLEVTPGNRLPLIVRIKRDDSGALSGTMDSPTQNVQGLPLAGISARDGHLTFAVPSIGGTYSGDWITTSSTSLWRGEWSQAGMKLPLLLFVLPPPPPPPADWQLPSNEAIAALIAARNMPRVGQGIVIGVVGPDGARFVAGGTGDSVGVDQHTLFEIGSITKVFTGLILADMINKGEVSLDDPAAKYLPAGRRMPMRAGRQITLLDLSVHRSGLPRMADDMRAIEDPGGPFAHYGEDKLLAFLDNHQLIRDIDSQWEYSNIGVGLLGYLLGRAAGKDYEVLLRERVTGPLGLNDTLVTAPPALAARLAAPFDKYMKSAPAWVQWGVLAGAGGVRSSTADMLKFAQALLDPQSPIAPAVRTALSIRTPTATAGVEQGLGWQIMHPTPGRDIVMHGGATAGFRSVLALEPEKGRAVVALANSAAEPGVEDVALHILYGLPVAPTPPPPKQPTEIALPVTELDKVVGRYDFGPGFTVVVTREGGTLRAQRDGGSVAQIFPEAPLAFFWKTVEARIRFMIDASGAVTGAEITQDNMKHTGTRLTP